MNTTAINDRNQITSRIKGFTLVEILFVVLIIGMLLAIATQSFISARANSRARACVSNLEKIDGAKQQFILDNKLGPTTYNANPPAVPNLVGTYLEVTPECPASGTYNVNNFSTDPTCSFGSTDGTISMHQLPT